MTFSRTQIWLLFGCLLAAITALRIAYLGYAPGFFFDEAQYWTWSQAMDWGFYSKPPMVASWIWLTTHACGDSEWCIRLSSPLLHLGTSLLVFATARQMYGNRSAIWSSLIYLTIPAVTLSSSLISTDPSLLFFWALSLYFFVMAIETKRNHWWLLCGIAAGLGLLSKYTMVFFAFSVAGFLITHKEYRKQLINPALWIGGALALVIFLPNILWNINNEFASFSHTKDNANLTGALFQPDQFLEFFGAQFGVFGPLLFLVLLYLLFHIPKLQRCNHAGLLLWSVIPFLFTIMVLSLLSRAHANWAAPIYVPATILVTHWLLNHARHRWVLYTSIGLHTLVFLAFISFPVLISQAGFTLTAKTTSIADKAIKDPFKRLRGWQELGEKVDVVLAQFPDAQLMTVSRKTHAYLRYYAKPAADNAVKWNSDNDLDDHYELTTALSDDTAQRYILISEWPDETRHVLKHFKVIAKLPNISIHTHKDKTLHYEVYAISHYTE